MFVQTLKHNLKIKPMKKNELRIGNFVYHPLTSRTYQVNENDLLAFAKNLVTNTPIPLTEEWLLKFGFSREEKIGGDGIEFRVYHFDVLTFNTNHGWWYKVQRMNDTPLEYVHQLQNFYFALTGKELNQQEQ